MDRLHDLLHEALIRARTCDTEDRFTLPGVLEALQANRIRSFPGLQAHQGHAWHAFLVQLSAIACHRAGADAATVDEARWRARLLALTDQQVEPWCLVVEDLAKPAFLQPPVPEGTLERFKGAAKTPDEIDILVTAKNHDVKAARASGALPDHWIFVIVTLQTMQGYLGRGNYGIARMNGGFSSRPAVGLEVGSEPGLRFGRDLRALLDARDKVADEYRYPSTSGAALLWLEPWDGAEQLSLEGCDPWFIEVCRRIRLEVSNGQLRARIAPSNVSRIAAEGVKGVTGDPWTPVDRKEAKALTISPSGLSYRLIHDLLFSGNFRAGAALEIRRDDPETIWLRASVLVRGQGETQGYHERTIPIPGHVRYRLGRVEERERIGKLSRQRIDAVTELQNKVLRPAICALLQAGADPLDLRDNRAARWIDEFDARVDARFFEEMWKAVDVEREDADRSWRELLWNLANDVLSSAKGAIPIPAARRFRALAAADRIMAVARRRWSFKEKTHDGDESSE